MITIDAINEGLAQTIFAIKGSWGLVFVAWARNYSVYNVWVYISLAWALFVSAIHAGIRLNRYLVSRGSTKLHEGDLVMITGGSSGLGLVLAALLSEKHRVCIVDLHPPPITLGNTTFHRINVQDTDAFETLETPKVLINCAAIARGGSVVDTPSDVMTELFNINVFSPVKLAKLFVPRMLHKKEGYIVNISSSTALVGPANAGAYAASKAALKVYHMALQHELIDSCIKFILCVPGQLDTPMFKSVQTPSESLSPVLPVTKLADELIVWLQNGWEGELAMPFYVRLLPIMNALLPLSVLEWLRSRTKADQAMRTFTSS